MSRAATAAIDAYGAEILGYLIACSPARAIAEEAFSELALNVWRGLPRFEWRCSCRTWLYTLARNRLATHVKREQAHRARRVNLSQAPELALMVERLTRAPHERTTFHEQLAEIRGRLPAEDRELLALRIDRQLEWEEIARIMSDDEACDRDGARLAPVAARLRKRFSRLKDRLRREFEELRHSPS